MVSLVYSILVVAITVASVVAATPPVNIDIKGVSGSAPLSTRVRITIDPHPANRFLCLTWAQTSGGSNYRSSCQELQGDQTPKTYWQLLKDLPSGKWEVLAYIVRSDEQATLSNRVTLHVLGPNYVSESEP